MQSFGRSLIFALLAVMAVGVCAQEAPKQAPPPLSATSRLNAAKTMYLKQGEGSEIPFNVVSEIMEGWGRFALVNSADKADIVLEVSAPADQGSSVGVSSSTGRGEHNPSMSASRQISNAPVKMNVYDARSHFPLWSGTEQPKAGMKQKAREDGLVEAAQKLVAKFREHMEPNSVK